MKTRRTGVSLMAMIVACGAAITMTVPAQIAEAGHRSRSDCRPSYSHHRSHSGYRYSSRPKVGFSVHIGTGGYSKYRSRSSYYGYSNCPPVYSSYSYAAPRYRYRAYTPSYRYECYDRPSVNTYYNNYSHNTYTYPTVPSGATTYRVWQQELQTPVVQQAQPAQQTYPSYNPGPAQPSPAPVAQSGGVVEWRRVDLREQSRELSRGVTKADRPQTVSVGTAPAREGSTPEQAWGMIESGDYTAARSAFASLTQTQPTSDEMKLGFGLANALDGRDSAAAWSLRRAVDGGVDLAASGEQLRGINGTLETLAARLAERADASGTGDSWFVLGVVQMIRGERDAAGLAVLQGLETGDRSGAMLRLAEMLEIEIPSDGDA